MKYLQHERINGKRIKTKILSTPIENEIGQLICVQTGRVIREVIGGERKSFILKTHLYLGLSYTQISVTNTIDFEVVLSKY